MSAPPSARGVRGAALRVRVEEARGVLPSEHELFVTLRLAPAEARHSRRTRATRRGLNPVRARVHTS